MSFEFGEFIFHIFDHNFHSWRDKYPRLQIVAWNMKQYKQYTMRIVDFSESRIYLRTYFNFQFVNDQLCKSQTIVYETLKGWI